MTELSFLIQMVLDKELPDKHRQMCAERIKEMEEKYNQPRIIASPASFAQPASTQKILDEMAMNPQPPQQVIPATPVAAQALASRAETIRLAAQGKSDNGRGGPRKF